MHFNHKNCFRFLFYIKIKDTQLKKVYTKRHKSRNTDLLAQLTGSCEFFHFNASLDATCCCFKCVLKNRSAASSY